MTINWDTEVADVTLPKFYCKNCGAEIKDFHSSIDCGWSHVANGLFACDKAILDEFKANPVERVCLVIDNPTELIEALTEAMGSMHYDMYKNNATHMNALARLTETLKEERDKK